MRHVEATTETPRISVNIPAYNAGATIDECLDTVLRQKVKPFEVLVLDDGSTDDTAERVRRYEPHVTLYQQENGGLSRARSALVRASRGDWIAFLDADDLWLPGYLETQTENIRRFPDAILSFTGFHSLSDGAETSADERIEPARTELIDPLEMLRLYGKTAGMLLPSFAMIRAETLRAMVPFPPEILISQDVYMWYRAALDGAFVRSHARAGYYRLHSESLSHDRLAMFEDRILALKHIAELCKRIAPRHTRRLVKRHLGSAYRLSAKHRFGTGDRALGRRWLVESLSNLTELKSLAMLALSYMPRRLQPHWPPRYRDA